MMRPTRTVNPTLNSETFAGFGDVADRANAMSIQGTVNKTAFLLLLVLLPAAWTWNLYHTSGTASAVLPWIFGGAFGGLVVAIITLVRKHWAPVTAPIYAVLEGLFTRSALRILRGSIPGYCYTSSSINFWDAICSSGGVQVWTHQGDSKFQIRSCCRNRWDLSHLCSVLVARYVRGGHTPHS